MDLSSFLGFGAWRIHWSSYWSAKWSEKYSTFRSTHKFKIKNFNSMFLKIENYAGCSTWRVYVTISPLSYDFFEIFANCQLKTVNAEISLFVTIFSRVYRGDCYSAHFRCVIYTRHNRKKSKNENFCAE